MAGGAHAGQGVGLNDLRQSREMPHPRGWKSQYRGGILFCSFALHPHRCPPRLVYLLPPAVRKPVIIVGWCRQVGVSPEALWGPPSFPRAPTDTQGPGQLSGDSPGRARQSCCGRAELHPEDGLEGSPWWHATCPQAQLRRRVWRLTSHHSRSSEWVFHH